MGFLNIFKPSGPTSHDIVADVRRATKVKQVGHAGTLDPLADGVLIIAVGFATRLIEYLKGDKKCYRATVELGYETDTFDRLGEVTRRYEIPNSLNLEALRSACAGFEGLILQVPPPFSAIKVKGKRAYALARKGQDLRLEARPVTVFGMQVEYVSLPELKLFVECSGGTYIRSLVNDLGRKVGCGATMTGLTRVSSGSFFIETSIDVSRLAGLVADSEWSDHLVALSDALPSIKQLILSTADLALVMNGQPISLQDRADELLIGLTGEAQPAAMLRRNRIDGRWWPDKVFLQVSAMSDKSQ